MVILHWLGIGLVFLPWVLKDNQILPLGLQLEHASISELTACRYSTNPFGGLIDLETEVGTKCYECSRWRGVDLERPVWVPPREVWTSCHPVKGR